jgi:phasin family protein
MLSNKQNFWSASNIFFQSEPASLQALARNAQRTAEKLTELNVAAAKALAAESRVVAQQCLLTDSPQALLTLALTQAQANVAKAHSYGRHLRNIVFGIRSDEFAEMKSAAQKISVPADHAAKKLHAVVTPALTLSD